MHGNADVQVETESIDDGVIFRPIGEIDLSGAPSLRTHLAGVQGKVTGRLIIDLKSVPYMDSSGVATLVEAMQQTRRRGVKLVLCNMQEKVRSIFEIARLDTVFTIVDNTDQAMAV